MERTSGPSGPTAAGLWRVLAPSLLLWAVAAVAIAVPGIGAWIAALGALVGGGLYVARIRRSVARRSRALPRLRMSGTLLITAAGLLLLGVRLLGLEGDRDSAELRAAAGTGRTIELEVRLTDYPGSAASVSGIRSWVRGTFERAPVIVWLDGPADPSWGPGTRLRVAGAVQPEPPESTTAFSVSARGSATQLPAGWETEFVRVLAEARSQLIDSASAVPGAELVPGFAVGDTRLVSETLDAQMRASSLTHLTAVSGSNCALVTGAVIWAASWLGAGRRIRAGLAAIGLLGFVVLIGPDASVQRAAVMAGAMLLAGFGGVPGSGPPALGAATALLLLVDPWQSRQPGFGLSVLATGGVLLLSPVIERWLRRRARLPRVLALPIAMSAAAQLACGPGLLLLEPGIPLAGVPANLLAAAAAPVGTGFGLAALLLQGIPGPPADAALLVASWAARWVAGVAEVCSELPLARAAWPDGWGGAVLLGAVQCAPLLVVALRRGTIALPRPGRLRQRAPWQPAPPLPLTVRVTSALIGAGAAGSVVAVTIAAPVAETAGTPRDWSLVACDVGQGDAILLRDPRAPLEVVLVDTGDRPELLDACLQRFGVERIALLVLTHDDRDHVGALGTVLDRVDAAVLAPPVGVMVSDGAQVDACSIDDSSPAGAATRASEPSNSGDRPPLRALCGAGVAVSIGRAGDVIRSAETDERGSPSDRASGIELTVLAPRPGERPGSANAASLVLRAQLDRVSVLLLADTGRDEHARLRRSGAVLGADVVKVAHHGSRDQDPALARDVGAALALVSVGADNRYGHPTDEALEAHEETGARVLRTDRLGSIAVWQERGELRVWGERAPERSPPQADVGGLP